MNETDIENILMDEQLEHENYLMSLIPSDEEEPWTECCGAEIGTSVDNSHFFCTSCHQGLSAEGLFTESL
jgi:hypothetical protein